MTRFFYDTEFIENGKTIDLVSIGVVDHAGREFYAVSTEFNPMAANDWVKANVLDKLPPRSNPAWMTRLEIRDRLHAFLTELGGDIELWAYYGAYDHIAYCQLWGPMISLPKGMPMFTHELMQLWELAGRPAKPPQPADQHDALADARWNRALFDLCTEGSPISTKILVGEPGPELTLPPAVTVFQTGTDTE